MSDTDQWLRRMARRPPAGYHCTACLDGRHQSHRFYVPTEWAMSAEHPRCVCACSRFRVGRDPVAKVVGPGRGRPRVPRAGSVTPDVLAQAMTLREQGQTWRTIGATLGYDYSLLARRARERKAA